MRASNAASAPSRMTVGIFLALLAAIAVFIGISGADAFHVSPDEVTDIQIAHATSLHNLLRYSLFETYPPLGHILRHYWLMLSDTMPFDRDLSLLFDLLLIPLFYRIGSLTGARWAGMGAAALIAFSNAVIVQSYVVRKYTIFLFFLSACLLAWGYWRRNRQASLLPYTALGVLTLLSHFSGLFAVFSITLAEAATLPRKREAWRLWARWAFANGLIAAVGLGTMAFWLPLLQHTETEALALGNGFDGFYHFFCLDYFFLYRTSVPYAFALTALVLCGLVAAFRIPAARTYAALALFALALSFFLQITRLYMPYVPRRSLWLLPLLVPPLGAVLGRGCEWLAARIGAVAVAALLLLTGALSYSPAARFSDPHEYMITESEWSALTGYLGKLDASHLIVASRADAFLITYPGEGDIYDYYLKPPVSEAGAWSDSSLALAIPYHDTSILFRPLFFDHQEKDVIAMVQTAETKGQLKGVSTLVITSTRWSRPGTLLFALCPELDKTVTAFPPPEPSAPLTREQIDKASTLVIEIPRQAFLNELIAPDGKARVCLGKYREE